jgi:hypothetical protein
MLATVHHEVLYHTAALEGCQRPVRWRSILHYLTFFFPEAKEMGGRPRAQHPDQHPPARSTGGAWVPSWSPPHGP